MSFFDANLRFTGKTFGKWLFLKGISLIYLFLIKIWLLTYSFGFRKGARVDKKVISVGNLTVGGTGKTPMIDWLLDFCEAEKIEAVVLSRGYKAKREEELQILNRESASSGSCENFGDEPWFLFQNHQNFNFYVSPNRVLAATQAEKKADLILLDDGMQHLKLDRDLNIVLVDTVAGLGNRSILPLGPLREPLSGLKRADIVVYTKTNLKNSKELRKELEPWLPEKTREFDSSFLPLSLISSENEKTISPEDLDKKRVLLISGIGNPLGFEKSIRNLGAEVVNHLILEDHQVYDQELIDKIRAFIGDSERHDLVVCTEKDWVKLVLFKEYLPEIFRIRMKMVLEEEFVKLIREFYQ